MDKDPRSNSRSDTADATARMNLIELENRIEIVSDGGAETSMSEYISDSGLPGTDEGMGLHMTASEIMDVIEKMHDQRMAKSLGSSRNETQQRIWLADAVRDANFSTIQYQRAPIGPKTLALTTKFIKIKTLVSDAKSELIDTYIKKLRIAGSLLMITGVLLFLFSLSLTINLAVSDYFRSSLTNHLPVAFVVLLGGIFQPIFIGLFCIMAVSRLRKIPIYMYRVPFTIVIPFGLFIHGSKYIYLIYTVFEQYLREQMISFKIHGHNDASYVWNGIQTAMSCCGIHSGADWKPHLNASGQAALPKSCCINQTDDGCPFFAPVTAIYSGGCLNSLQYLNFGIGIVFIGFAVLEIILEIFTVVYFRKLNNLYTHLICDDRTACKIIFGDYIAFMCSCKSNDGDDIGDETLKDSDSDL